MPTTAILLVAHGTPERVEDIPAFLDNIRRGRSTPPQIVQEVRRRYEAIGGRSPLLDTTRAQAEALSRRTALPSFVAMRMWHPYIEDVLREISERGFDRLVVLTMAPHSAHVYEPVVREAAARLARQGATVPELLCAPCWGDEPALHRAWAEATLHVISALDPRELARAVLVPSAHSLPMRVVQAGDPYPQLVHETAEGVLAALGQSGLPHILAFQSQGMTADPWLGPDLPTVFERARTTGARSVVVLPIGFLSDHVETLYDLDIEARALAAEAGLAFHRVPCLNASDRLIEAMQRVVQKLIGADENALTPGYWQT